MSCIAILNIYFKEHVQPIPTDKTYVNEDMETAKTGLNKELWLNEIHKAAPGVDWREIEEKNRFNSYKKFIQNSSNSFKDNTVNIANGKLLANWNEKGSNNLSGSITYMNYDSLHNIFYAISAGGSLWQYNFDGFGWKLINDKLKFDNRFLELSYLPSGETQIICSISGKPYYSMEGLEWTLSSGPQILNNSRTKNLRSLQDGKYIFYLADEGPLRNIKLFYSDDYGRSFKALYSFSNSDLNNFSIDVCETTKKLYCIEQLSLTKSNIYHWSPNNQEFKILQSQSSISFGSEGRANIRVRQKNNNTMFFAYNGNKQYFSSDNLGMTWKLIGSLPVTPWEDGIFVSYKDPNLMIISEVEAYVSRNGGQVWQKVNSWGEYYDDPITKLHADMMHIEEFNNGFTDIITIANHGGVNLSYDKMQSNYSIAQLNLNISQYYSVRTYPLNPEIIFAGSQDQGIQRGYDFEEGTVTFTQLFSGDYGHICFSNFNKSMWTVYPGGWVFYFDDPVNNNFSNYNYHVNSLDESVWLPPLISSPYHFNSVLLAGGSKNSGAGSYILELKIGDFNGLTVTQWPFDFSSSGGTVTGMAFNRFFTNVFYAITSNGKFYKSINNGQSFTNVAGALNNAHYLYGHEILSSKNDSKVLYIAGSGYSNSPIFKSENGGENFYSIQANLPSTTIFDIDIDSEGEFLFAATEAGAYVYIEDLKEWHELGQNIAPNQSYWSVEFLQSQNKVRFGTYGRGIWDLDIQFLSHTHDIHETLPTITLFPNPTSDYLNIATEGNWDRISIVNLQGNILETVLKPNAQLNFHINHYPKGIYYAIFESSNKMVTKKFIKI